MTYYIDTAKIVKFMEQNKLSKTAFCKKCKIGYATLVKILNNDDKISLVPLFKVSRVLKIRLCDLFIK